VDELEIGGQVAFERLPRHQVARVEQAQPHRILVHLGLEQVLEDARLGGVVSAHRRDAESREAIALVLLERKDAELSGVALVLEELDDVVAPEVEAALGDVADHRLHHAPAHRPELDQQQEEQRHPRSTRRQPAATAEPHRPEREQPERRCARQIRREAVERRVPPAPARTRDDARSRTTRSRRATPRAPRSRR
jgi:hypothetical protein